MRAAAECEKILETMAVPVGLDERARLVDAARGPRRKTKYSRETVDPRSVDRGNESEKERSSVRRWTSGDGGAERRAEPDYARAPLGKNAGEGAPP